MGTRLKAISLFVLILSGLLVAAAWKNEAKY
jgi:hypothetical protein